MKVQIGGIREDHQEEQTSHHLVAAVQSSSLVHVRTKAKIIIAIKIITITIYCKSY